MLWSASFKLWNYMILHVRIKSWQIGRSTLRNRPYLETPVFSSHLKHHQFVSCNVTARAVELLPFNQFSSSTASPAPLRMSTGPLGLSLGFLSLWWIAESQNGRGLTGEAIRLRRWSLSAGCFPLWHFELLYDRMIMLFSMWLINSRTKLKGFVLHLKAQAKNKRGK